MNDPQVSASAVILGELREFRREHREDMSAVSARLGAIEVEQGKQQVKLEAVEKSVAGAWKRVRMSAWDRVLRLVDFLVEMPALAKIVLLAVTLLLGLWGGTHAWLVSKVEAELHRPLSQPGLQADRNRVQSNGRD